MKNVKILILSNNNLLKEYLNKVEWIQTEYFFSEKDLENSYERNKYDIILLDLLFYNDLKIVRDLRKKDNQVLIIVIADEKMVVNDKFLESGIDDFLISPYEFSLVVSKIFLLLSRMERLTQTKEIIDKKYSERIRELRKSQENLKRLISGTYLESNMEISDAYREGDFKINQKQQYS